jgi:hypothetical protein
MSDQITTSTPSTTNEISPDPVCYKRYKRAHALAAEQKLAIHLLLRGHTDQQVADTVKVHRVTLTRWRLYHPLFQTELNRQRQALWHNQADRLRSLLAPSIDLLQSHLSSASERSSFRAAVSLIRLAIKLGAPTGPTDEYRLLMDYLRAERLEAEKYQQIFWPPRKEALDELREYLLKKSADLPLEPDPTAPEMRYEQHPQRRPGS